MFVYMYFPFVLDDFGVEVVDSNYPSRLRACEFFPAWFEASKLCFKHCANHAKFSFWNETIKNSLAFHMT